MMIMTAAGMTRMTRTMTMTIGTMTGMTIGTMIGTMTGTMTEDDGTFGLTAYQNTCKRLLSGSRFSCPASLPKKPRKSPPAKF